MRLLDYKKQYVCMDVHNIEELQELAHELDVYSLVMDEGDADLPFDITAGEIASSINNFISNLTEQEKVDEKTAK
jgi:hypothetical protein